MLQLAKHSGAGRSLVDPACGPRTSAEAMAAAAPSLTLQAALPRSLSNGPSCLGYLSPSSTWRAPAPHNRRPLHRHPVTTPAYRVPLLTSSASAPSPLERWTGWFTLLPTVAGDCGHFPHTASLNASCPPPPHHVVPWWWELGLFSARLGQVPSVWASMSHPSPVPQEDLVYTSASESRTVFTPKLK